MSERGFCGLTTVEALRRELVQRLAVGDATHSSLLKALPPRLQDNKHVQECLDAVAAFRSPSGMQQVVLSHVFCTTYDELVWNQCMLVRKEHKFPAEKYCIFVAEGWVVTILESVAVCLFLGSW